ncbi:leucine-rich repeat and guanylate kinase domain-containing protein [Aplochiton taeniatus]
MAETRDSSPFHTTCNSHGSFNQEGIHEQPSSNNTANQFTEKFSINPPGVLTVEMASKCLSNLGHSATGLHHVYQFLCVPGRNLNDVSILCNYIHLQKLELPYNKIKDLSCVSHMPYLIVLDASHNEISDYFEFQPPKNLKEVNFSHNKMSKMKELSAYSSLSELNLDYNHFSEICGLKQCTSLTYLSLAHNKIFRISGLDNLPLKDLCLRGNKLKKIEKLETLSTLQVLDLSLNQIHSASGLQTLHILDSINLESNLISDIKDASHLHDLFLLRELNLQNNPVQEKPDYRQAVIFLLQHLTRLDQEKVTAEEKVYSGNKYDPPLEVVAARDHMTHMVYQLMQPQVLYDSTLPSLDSPYPMLVLTGPQACGKRELAHKLCFEFNNYFAYGACHTTRGPYFGEEDGRDYHFVTDEEFQNMIYMGKFVETMHYGGHRYGLSRSSIEEVAREGLACCVHMELEGVMSLKNTYFEPRYVLLIPTDMEQYAKRLGSRNLYTQTQIDSAVGRIELYTRTNRDRPGFFDDVICCDDPAEGYQTLRQVVKEYLGLDEQEDRPTSAEDTAMGLCVYVAKETTEESKVTVTSFRRSESAFKSHVAPAVDQSDSQGRNYRNKVQSQLTTQKTSAELASIYRREHLIREALVGKSPGAYSQLFKRSAQTASSSLTSHIQDPSLSSTRPLKGSTPHGNLKDSSSDESHACSALSVPSSAGALGLDPSNHVDSSLSPDTRSLGSGKMSHRPGSNVKPVLPPIPSGRKTPA